MSVKFIKREYTDHETIITAQNLNEIQDALLELLDIEETAKESAESAEESKEAAEEATKHYPKIINGYWHVWDVNAGEYVSTGEKAQGETGETGLRGEKGEIGPQGPPGKSGAPVIYNIASGDIASFDDGADDMPIKTLVVGIEPVQDFHGYDSSWPAGGGINLFDASKVVGNNISVDGEIITVNSQSGSGVKTIVPLSAVAPSLQAGDTCALTLVTTGTAASWMWLRNGTGAESRWDSGTVKTLDEEDLNGVFKFYGSGTIKMQITRGSTPAAWTPYENICPISGWTGTEIHHSGTDTDDPQNIPVSWATEAGTVYAGTLDATSGELTVTWAGVIFDGTQPIAVTNWAAREGSSAWLYPNTYNSLHIDNDTEDLLCDTLKPETYFNVFYGAAGISLMSNTNYSFAVRVPVTGLTTAAAINAYLAEHPIQVVYRLTEPVTYQITPETVNTLLGGNNIWADCGDVSVEYPADTKLYIAAQTKATRKLIAGVETGMTASKSYSAGDMLIVGDTLYKATVPISSGATLTIGTNVNQTTVVEQLLILANA